MTSTQWLVVVAMILGISLKVICFLFGYLIVKIGAQLLRDGVTGEFKLKTQLSGFNSDLASASPGLLFLVIGAGLIGYAMYLPKTVEYEATDAPSPPALVLPDR